jgi:hypothetical protein
MPLTRRDLFALALGGLATAVLRRDGATAPPRGPHPTPRPGIDASKVLTKDQLHKADAAPIFGKVRQIPEIIDGIRCHCGCAEQKDKYSLLSCFEGDGMGQHCEVCQGQAKLAFSLHRLHRSLDQIRASIDARFDK